MRPQVSRVGWQYALIVLGVALAYFSAAKLGLSLAVEAPQISAVWPPTGIALAAVLRFGIGVLPGIFAGAFAANATIEQPLWVAAGIASGNMLEALCGAFLLTRVRDGDGPVRLAFGFIAAAALAPIVSASIGVTCLVAGGVQQATFLEHFRVWWVGDALGALVLAPVLSLSRKPPNLSARPYVELGLVVAAAALLCGAVFYQSAKLPFTEYIVFPFIIWAAMRLSMPATALVVAVCDAVAVAATYSGFGPFAGLGPERGLLHLQIFVAVAATTGLLLAAVAERQRASESAAQARAQELEAQSHARSQAEEALRQSEARFRALMEQAPFSVQVFAPDGTTLQVNRAWQELWGVTVEDIGGYNVLEDPQLEAQGVLPYLRRAFAGEAASIPAILYDSRETLPNVVADDHPLRWVAAVAYPLKDGVGRVREVVLVHEDITARTRAEQELRQSEEKLRLLADTIPQLAWMARSDGYIFWYNRQWYEYTGTTPEQMVGWGWQSVHDPAVLPEVLQRWRQSLEQGGPFEMVFPLRAADAQFRPFLTRVNPLRAGDGRILYWFGTNTDISEIKRMEDALREADRRKDEFLATLAHELRNPLAPIANSLQILKIPHLDSAAAHHTRDIIERQVNHLVRLVDDLLDVSRVMRGRVELRKEPVELAIVVARAVETVQPLVDAQKHRLEISMPEEPLVVYGDPVRLIQVIANLLSNAAKYTEPNGTISVVGQERDAQAVLHVRDTGIGIASEVLPHVFDLFVQAEHAANRAQGGLGIGLTLAKNLLEMHDAHIEARSGGLGKGAEFTIRLPLMQETHRDDAARPRETLAPGTTGLRVLVVDDNKDAADSLALLLRLRGHDIRVAHDGTSALVVAQSHRPAVVFLDIGMPGMDGYEVVRRMRSMPEIQGTVIAALTGWGQQEDRARTAAAGFDHHLVKPVASDVLETLIDRIQIRSERNAMQAAYQGCGKTLSGES